jgi:fatty acid desaturase
LSVAIVSMIVLVIVGALGGLLFFRTFGGAVARNENQPEGKDDEAQSSQGSLREETRRSIWFFLGVGASVTAILIDVAGVATAFSGSQEFLNDAVPIAFLAFALAVVGYFLGARMLAAGAIVFTVIALSLAAVVIQWL